MIKTIIGIYAEREYAERGIRKLEEKGFVPQDISIIMKDREEGKKLASDTGASVAGGAASGAATGAVIGGIAGLLVGIGAIAIPGFGAILIGGPIAAALGLTGAAATTTTGAATGALAGGLLGMLVSLGIPEDEARTYEERIREGGILLAVPTPPSREEEVYGILSDTGAEQVRTISNHAPQRVDEYTEDDYTDVSQYSGPSGGYYAGAKGGQQVHEGKGWFGQPKRHSKAARKRSTK